LGHVGRSGNRTVRPLLTLLAIVVVVLALAAPAHAAFPGANGKIAFGFANHIWVINPDGTGRTQITTANDLNGLPTFDDGPAWSPDGTKITFTRACSDEEACGGRADVFVMNADGTGETNLTNSFGTGDSGAAWSPDGQKIVFSSRRSPAGFYVMNADGTGVARLSDPGGSPAWSPDGSKISFDGCRSGACGIYVMNADGTGAVQITNVLLDEDAAWSPDGQKIAFTRYSGGRTEIYTMNADGGGQMNLSNDSITGNDDTSPAWSPDGQKIAWQKSDYSARHIQQLWIMNADGSGKAMVDNTGFYSRLDWEPLPFASYPHPQSASQLSLSLVPTFRPCGTPASPTNAQHSSPLSNQACSPPTPGSSVARVGPNAQASAGFTVIPGDTDLTNGNQADISLIADLTDIQMSAGGDYDPNPTGADLTEVTRLRITDSANGYGGLAATASEYDFGVPIACSPTNNPRGATCAANTTANTLIPGFVQEQKHAVVQAFRVRIDDSGVNGVRGDSDDRIFATQGVFVP
jgi:Tol biopolymer transport system component